MSDTFDPSAPGDGDDPEIEAEEAAADDAAASSEAVGEAVEATIEEAVIEEVIEELEEAIIEEVIEEVAEEIAEAIVEEAIEEAIIEEVIEEIESEGATADDLGDAELLDIEEVTPSRSEPSPFDRPGALVRRAHLRRLREQGEAEPRAAASARWRSRTASSKSSSRWKT